MVFFIDEAHSRTPPTNVNKKMVFLNEGFPYHCKHKSYGFTNNTYGQVCTLTAHKRVK